METTELQDVLFQAPYLEHLALKTKPFSLTPDPAFYFDSRTHSKALRGLQSFLSRQEGFALIYGDVGTGKTLLCRRFLQGLDRKAYSVGLILNPTMNETEFLAEALRAFDITSPSPRGETEGVEALRSHIKAEGERGKQSVLAVDEAQLLSDDLFDLLTRLSYPGNKGDNALRVVLFAQEEIAARLVDRRMRRLRQRITMTHRLQPLSSDEIGPYIMHRLATAGSGGLIRFDADAVDIICRVSRGYARVINTVSDHCLFILGQRSRTRVTRRIVNQVLKEDGIVASPGEKRAAKPRLWIAYLAVSILILALMLYGVFVLLRPSLGF